MKRIVPKIIYLEVIVRQIYGFEEKMINGWDTQKVIEDWFESYNINSSHATRDGHHYGNIDTIVSIRETSPTEFEPHVNSYFKKINDAKEKIEKTYKVFLKKIKEGGEAWEKKYISETTTKRNL